MDYDPLTGSPLPRYFTDSGLPSDSPITGDSGYSYAKEIIDLLKFGVGQSNELKRAELEAKTRYELGRAGLTPLGQPIGTVQVGGMAFTPGLVILGIVGALGAAYLASR